MTSLATRVSLFKDMQVERELANFTEEYDAKCDFPIENLPFGAAWRIHSVGHH